AGSYLNPFREQPAQSGPPSISSHPRAAANSLRSRRYRPPPAMTHLPGSTGRAKEPGQAGKLASLKFLGHWVGDIHQPLHVSFEDDRGGNNIAVTGECGSNLHSAWDTCLVLKAVGEDAGAAAT